MYRYRRHQHPSTRFSACGRIVSVTLPIDRRKYEFGYWWAVRHAAADPYGTAEEHLAGYMSVGIEGHMNELNWRAPAAIEALYPLVSNGFSEYEDFKNTLPF